MQNSDDIVRHLAGVQPQGGMLIIGDHAGNAIPHDADPQLADKALINTHIAIDIGTADIAHILHHRYGHHAILATVSRLVVDLNRRADEEAVIPEMSDGVELPGNILSAEQRAARIKRYYWSYHDAVAEAIKAQKPEFLLFIHSFTPQLASHAEEDKRPWHFGVMVDQDKRAGDLALEFLRQTGYIIGDQLPYSGVTYNSSLARHGENTGTPYIGLEIRQDLAGNPQKQAELAKIIHEMAQNIIESLASSSLYCQ